MTDHTASYQSCDNHMTVHIGPFTVSNLGAPTLLPTSSHPPTSSLPLTWLQLNVTPQFVGHLCSGVVSNPPHDGSMFWFVLGRPEVGLNLARTALDLTSKASSKGTR